MTITLYDLTSTVPGKAYAPNPYKIRIALAYKGLPFTTEWFEYPDLQVTLKALGAPPTSVSFDGSNPRYTTPTIIDNSTGKIVTESIVVAEYLDGAYPDKAALFPVGSAAAVHLFDLVWHEQVAPHIRPLMVYMTYLNINPISQVFYKETREARFKCKIEEILPTEKRPEQLEKLKASLSKIAALFDKNGKYKPFFFGDTFSYADCIAGGWLMWAKKMLNPHEWEVIAGFDGGRWARLIEYCEKLESSV